MNTIFTKRRHLPGMKINNTIAFFGKMIVFVFIIMHLCKMHALSQQTDFYLENKRYSFINYDSNCIHTPNYYSGLDTIYKLIDTIIIKGTGKLQVLHIGGSHIQADIYTHVIRKRLQNLSFDMNGGRGLIFPYRIAKTNGPSNFLVKYDGNWNFCKNTQTQKDCNLGITGYSVNTFDSIAQIIIDMNRDSSIYYTYNSVRIFHEPSSYKLAVQVNDRFFAGYYNDTLGYTRIELDNDYDEFHLIIKKDSIDDSFSLLGISFDSDNPGVVYNSVGVNGAMLKSYLRCNLYKKHLKAISPHLIIFSIGTNDAYTRSFDKANFRKEYRQLLDSTLEVLPGAQIIITVPNDSYLFKRYVNHNTAKMRDIIYELSIEYGCSVWDFYTVMGGLNSVQAWYSLNLMKYDKVHFNRQGYLLKGDLFFSAFLKGWESQFANDFHKISNQTK